MLIHWHKKNPAGNPGGTDGRKTKPDGEQTIINSSNGILFRFTDELLINASTFCFFSSIIQTILSVPEFHQLSRT